MHARPPLTPAQQVEHGLRNDLLTAQLHVTHLQMQMAEMQRWQEQIAEMLHDQEQVTIRLMAELAAMTKARDFQRQRADRGWALYERTANALIDLQEGELLDLRNAVKGN